MPPEVLDDIPNAARKPEFIPVRRAGGRIVRTKLGDRKGQPPIPTTWIDGEYVFVSFNCGGRVQVPPRVMDYGRRSIYEMGNMEWEQPGFPYLPFLSTQENWNGKLLRRLAIDEKHFPTVRSGAAIKISPKLIDAWVRLEDNVKRMIDLLKAASGFHAIKFLPLPNSRRLYKLYSDKAAAFREACTTRDRFLFLLAILTFFVAIKRDFVPFEMTELSVPIGVQRYLEFQADCIAGGVHSQWVVFLSDSSINWGMNVKRRGVFIDYRRTEFSALATHMIASNVPVVLRIEERTMYDNVDLHLQDRLLNRFIKLNFQGINVDGMNAVLRKLIPPRVVVQRIRVKMAVEQIEKGFDFRLEDAVDQPGGDEVLWEPSPLSTQPPENHLDYESREDFFARRDKEREALILRESDTARQRRINREALGMMFTQPGAKNTTTQVYEWQWDGYREVRKLVLGVTSMTSGNSTRTQRCDTTASTMSGMSGNLRNPCQDYDSRRRTICQ